MLGTKVHGAKLFQIEENSPILPKSGNDIIDSSNSQDNRRGKVPSLKHHWYVVCIVLAVSLLLLSIGICLSITLAAYYGTKSSHNKDSLVDSITTADLKEMLLNLQDIAVNNSRSVLNGYNNSAEFVFTTLVEHGYQPRRQYFKIPVPEKFNEKATFKTKVFINEQNYEMDYIQNSHFRPFLYSSGCTITEDNNCTSGLVVLMDACNAINEDSVSKFTGKAVLVHYEFKNCSLYKKALNVKAAGATAIIFMSGSNSSTPPLNIVFERNDNGTVSHVDIICIGVNEATGHQLLNFMRLDLDMQVTLQLAAKVTYATTYNILAETKGGRTNRVVMLGSHLDSVPAGPGINDDGSGSMANLLFAIKIAELNFKPENKIRFAWWGAEELGILGSQYYVSKLSPPERNNISLYLNFDMLGSPNFIRGIYNASSGLGEDVLKATTKIRDLFIEYFDKINLKHQLVSSSNARSDHSAFLDVGIPAGGLFSGAESLKTIGQWQLFGGMINVPLDPCYHQACDTVNNVDYGIYLEMTQAAAYVLKAFAEQQELSNYLNK